MAEKSAKAVWVKALSEAPLFVRRRASAYLKNIQRSSENEWLVWSSEGTEYKVLLEKGLVECSCPYFKDKSYCKHVCAVAAYELARLDVIPWLEKLEEKL